MSLMFERESWKEFRTLDGLWRMAGVSRNRIAAVVAKELVDNALDEAPFVEVGMLEDNSGFFVEDDGPGIDPAQVASLFSIKRPQRSTKFLRLPTRGALGNGLRVVASAALCTQGQLRVSTRGQTMKLIPQDDGSTIVEVIGKYDGKGTRVEVVLGPDAGELNKSPTLRQANIAILFGSGGTEYIGKTSAYWYTSRDLYELFNSAKDKDMTVRKLLTEFEGGDNSTISAGFKGKQASEITLSEAGVLLQRLKDASKPVKASRLGKCNTPDLEEYLGHYYAKIEGIFRSEANREIAEIPYVVEAWARLVPDTNADFLQVLVNRTPITGEVAASRSKTDLHISGCNISEEGYCHAIPIGKKHMWIFVNITTPYVPKTTEGKNPDLLPFKFAVTEAIKKAVRKANKGNPEKIAVQSQKEIVLENLDEAIGKTSGNHQYRFTQRMLYYAVREIVAKAGAGELKYKNFTAIITDYENDLGNDLPGMIRDDRGAVYHPHMHKTLSLGSRMVESYQPPDWTFNKVLFIEKEGFFQILVDEKWPERHDCALLSSKGQATRAVRDLIDGLKDSKEDITVYAIHDADAAGTMIYQALVNETKARKARKVEIINLGLEPWDGLDMGIEPEPVTYEKDQPVAQYVYDKDPYWAKWLQTQRIELNALTTPELLVWLDAKMEGTCKLVPPKEVLAAELRKTVRGNLEKKITARILEEADFEDQVETEFQELAPAIDANIETISEHIAGELEREPTISWKDVVTTSGMVLSA